MREFVARGALQAGFLSALIAVGIETGKLFFVEARPDPTDVLIAAASAASGFILLSMGTKAILNVDFTEQDIITDDSHVR
jgi:hypothetical protein